MRSEHLQIGKIMGRNNYIYLFWKIWLFLLYWQSIGSHLHLLQEDVFPPAHTPGLTNQQTLLLTCMVLSYKGDEESHAVRKPRHLFNFEADWCQFIARSHLCPSLSLPVLVLYSSVKEAG